MLRLKLPGLYHRTQDDEPLWARLRHLDAARANSIKLAWLRRFPQRFTYELFDAADTVWSATRGV